MSDVITLSNVSITHPGASTPTLRNINLTVAEGGPDPGRRAHRHR